MTHEKRPPQKPTVWVGECVCGLVVYETTDGKRYAEQTRRLHSAGDCQARRRRQLMHVASDVDPEP